MEQINIVNQAVNKLAAIIKHKQSTINRLQTVIQQLQTQMRKNESPIWHRFKNENEKLKEKLDECQSTIAVLSAESNALLNENKKLKEELKKANKEREKAAEEKKRVTKEKVVSSSDTAQTSDIGNAKVAESTDEAKEEENMAKESDAEDVEMRDNSQQPTVNWTDCDSTNLAIDADQESKKKE